MSEKSKSSFGTDSDHDSEEDAKEKATAFDQLILSQRMSQTSKEPRRSSAKLQKQEQEAKNIETRKTLFSQRTFGSGIMPGVTGAKVALDKGENDSVEDRLSSSSDDNDAGDNAKPQAIIDDINYFGPTAI